MQRTGELLEIHLPGLRLDEAELLLAKAVQLLDIASAEQLYASGTRLDDDYVYDKLNTGREQIAKYASRIDAEDNQPDELKSDDSDFE